jgi:hypothetical protein
MLVEQIKIKKLLEYWNSRQLNGPKAINLCKDYQEAKQIKLEDWSVENNLPNITAIITEVFLPSYKTTSTRNTLLFLTIKDETDEISLSISTPDTNKLTTLEKGKTITIHRSYLKTNNKGTVTLNLRRGWFEIL